MFELIARSVVESRTFWQGGGGGQTSGGLGDRATAGQNLRETQRTAEADSARRRLVGGATGSGASNALELSKHKSPGHEESAKDSVSFYDLFPDDLEQTSSWRNESRTICNKILMCMRNPLKTELEIRQFLQL